MNLDRRYEKWLRAHYPMWQEGCCCAICVAISAEDEVSLRKQFQAALTFPLPEKTDQLDLTNWGAF